MGVRLDMIGAFIVSAAAYSVGTYAHTATMHDVHNVIHSITLGIFKKNERKR